jgi:hypothetical protein
VIVAGFLQATSPGKMGEFFCRTLFGFLSGKASVFLEPLQTLRKQTFDP